MSIPSTYHLTKDEILQNSLLRRLMDKRKITIDHVMNEISYEYNQNTWLPI